MARKWQDQDLVAAVQESTSIAQVLGRLGLAPAGGNYASIKRAIESRGLNTEHFVGQSWSKGRTLGERRPLEDYLSNQFSITSHRLRIRLIKEGVFEHECHSCGNKKWLGQPISLELEHVDGNHRNNSLDNLKLLCPNCHAQTSTYRGKNIGKTHAPMVE